MNIPIDEADLPQRGEGAIPDLVWHRRQSRSSAATKPQYVMVTVSEALAVPPSFFTAEENNVWNQTLFTSAQSQLTSKVVLAGQRIDYEEHNVDQYFFVYSGMGLVRLRPFVEQMRVFDASQERVVSLQPMTTLVVPAGVGHQVEAISDLKMLSIYVPPQHPRGLRQETKDSVATAYAQLPQASQRR